MNGVRAILVAFGFLTRVPVPLREVRPADLGRSLAFFPLVGLALGLALAGSARLLGARLPAGVEAVLLAAILAIVTGGLHQDGLADVVDGLSGCGGDRARALEIMRDSRIGAHGAVAIVLVLAAKIAALAEVARTCEEWPLVLFPLAARWAVTPLVVFFPYAREEGLGRSFKDNASALEVVFATGIAWSAIGWVGQRAVAPAVAAVGTALAVAAYVRWKLGGLTGDVYGAAIELAEVAFLVAVAGAGQR
ncbi:adenosylcobinamide-GDP ribazoletransferase [bacterium]|nr:adenosylcobinamide-GDP ribazoletransferase [bacterium]